ncbi:MAG TPA: (E)-4-hydroxy-3-methylbut-2-enyl-diphosphate synthase [Bacteroidales bacterium]|jgi:(E)-4-hydroxy-3-methylbut-2-enyl-diphosphate synthase|nr:(E)-4-hydroxy-3-methylbut-2-enyl-diphosphate synthase [Bacteroidales bacterium]HOL98790.1 (E)-4-hydroxy-3-methylbut-2-enyl-diphosphate synthase [Bacteroidales bacterium]HOM37048.1 (E)-4-hydroxy-3-methylbut-2-enyl-diphosphate synthase [Bacteroidales bacterium]HPD24673.1 (E)-4-hydroxy-3-methylbut-2-enyl-diphosphate synthase [Bacteroidales bacterium]HRT00418.1 (E)-4-hydroxy-3-methylbut-2-enyl-diphosphate synthase [Bacteroidales bacterium]
MTDFPDRYCIDIHNREKIPTRIVKIGNVELGGNNPIRLQSMTNIPVENVKATINQCKQIFDSGADFVRISVPRIMDVEFLKEVKKKLSKENYNNPLIADIHFNPAVAEEAAKVVEKVRINPGNYIDKRAQFKKIEFSETEYQLELEKMYEKLLPLIKICKEYGTAIRIGSNHGSLSDRIMSRYGNTVQGMVEAAWEYIQIFAAESFFNLVISMKASDTAIMTRACRLLNAKMMENHLILPQHLGVTEAGNETDGRIKSAIGIGALLSDGIGDTIRVSLTENPVNEIIFAKKFLELYNNRLFKFQVVSQITNTYNPYKHSSKYPNILNCNRFAIISRHDTENTDFVFIEKIPENFSAHKNYITPYATWKGNKKLKNLFPLIDIVDLNISKLKSEYFYFVKIRSFDVLKREFYEILSQPNVCFVLEFLTENPLGETRYFYKEISKINKKASVIITQKILNTDYEKAIAEAGIFPGGALIDILASGIWIETNEKVINSLELSLQLLQATGIRYSKAEFISCPGCGRTEYNLEELTKKAKEAFSEYKGIKIAIMGCIVNGPGEMADANYGIVGATNNKVHVYKGKEVVYKNIEEDKAISLLKQLIDNDKI